MRFFFFTIKLFGESQIHPKLSPVFVYIFIYIFCKNSVTGFYSGEICLCWQKDTKSVIRKCGEIIIVKKGKFMNFL